MLVLTDEQLDTLINFTKTNAFLGGQILSRFRLAAFEELKELRKESQRPKKVVEFEIKEFKRVELVKAVQFDSLDKAYYIWEWLTSIGIQAYVNYLQCEITIENEERIVSAGDWLVMNSQGKIEVFSDGEFTYLPW